MDNGTRKAYTVSMKNAAKQAKAETDRTCNLLRSMLSTWDSLTDSQKATALRKAAGLYEVKR